MKRILLLSVLLLGACASDKTEVRSYYSNSSSITSYAKSLIGTPYKYGGNSPEYGFDCSGFVVYVFRQSLGVKLPRTTGKIRYAGKAVGKKNLRAGDLVFFNTLRRKFSHVGIYLGDNRFIHAPSGGGSVRIENMMAGYWRGVYNGARRITYQR
jgi:cell wall-associated NlpC family hydrolase